MNPCAICYDPHQSVDSKDPFSPSSKKPALLVERIRQGNLPIEWFPVVPATFEDITLAHDPSWAKAILNCLLPNGFGSYSLDIASSLLWTVGSMISACFEAKPDRPAFSPTSGFHHAGWNTAQGFCTFNGLVIAARKSLSTIAGKVAILDMDAHYGNGTDEILFRLGLRKQITHWTFGKEFLVRVEDYNQTKERARELNFGLRSGYLEAMKWVPQWLEREMPDLLIYQAGADSHFNDPYGGVLFSEDLHLRDRIVFEAASSLGIPVAWNLAGGYQIDEKGSIDPVLDLHLQTLKTACGVT